MVTIRDFTLSLWLMEKTKRGKEALEEGKEDKEDVGGRT